MNSHMKRILFFVFFSLILLLIGRNLLFLPKFSFSSPQNETIELKKQIQELLKNKKGTYSVYYRDVKNGVNFGINENQVYIAGSLNKVPIVATLYALAKNGKLDLDDMIVLQKDDIADYGTGSLRYQKPGSSYTLKELSRLALEKSDNTAAKLIATRIGTDVIQKHIDEWGMTQTHMINNKTSAKDMDIIFEKIYKGDIASPAHTPEFLDFLSDTDFEDRIPLFLSKDIVVYHKTGDVVGGIHDAGIVKTKKNVFFLSVLTANIGEGELAAKKTIGEIAQKIIEFQNQHE